MEKRREKRIPLNLKIDYCLADIENCPVKETYINNLSPGGLQLIINEPMSITTTLKLSIHSPRLLRPINCRSRVVWVKEVKAGQTYEIGTIFEQISVKDIDFIRKWTRTVDLDDILISCVKKNASDLHLIGGQPPMIRVYGELLPLRQQALTPDEVQGLVYNLLLDSQKERFEKELELDFSYMNEAGRFRVNLHRERGQMGASFRHIPAEVKTIEELGLPPVLLGLARKQKGLILVTGANGSGKSTTLAAMIEQINRERKRVVMSLEEPIEFLYKSKRSVIEQREIGVDSHSFRDALKYVVRQDIDVILIGEIRDLDSISIALTAAETGHLVFTTLHTLDTITSINRIIDVFPANQQQQIRFQLAETLQGVVSQALLPRADGDGRVVATEVLICTPAVSNMIRKGKHEEIHSQLETGRQFGMHTLEKSLEELYSQDMISKDTVLSYSKELHKYI